MGPLSRPATRKQSPVQRKDKVYDPVSSNIRPAIGGPTNDATPVKTNQNRWKNDGALFHQSSVDSREI